MAAILRSGRRFRQCGAGVFQRVGVTHGLLQAPLMQGLLENSVQIQRSILAPSILTG